jgi:type IV pilus assembly protein PilW
MVGITVGMIIVAGASTMMVNQIDDHRRLTLETQIQQDLRAAADLMLRDLRRSGFRGKAFDAVWAPDMPTTANPYPLALQATANGRQVLYSYTSALDAMNAAKENNVVDANENFGYRLNDQGVLQFNLGGTWQPLTDPNTLRVTDFRVRINTQTLSLKEFCPTPCPVDADCPRQQIHDVALRLTGEAVHDRRVERSINVSTRLRNDAILGVCPAS